MSDTPRDREAQMAEAVAILQGLLRYRDATHMDYINSAWASGPGYRRQLDEIDGRIRTTRAAIAQLDLGSVSS
jgi:hypothetical protein